jgi:hypothetical protein
MCVVYYAKSKLTVVEVIRDINSKEMISEERRFSQDLHGATSQKTAFFIVTAVKTSNLTDLKEFKCFLLSLIFRVYVYFVIHFICLSVYSVNVRKSV